MQHRHQELSWSQAVYQSPAPQGDFLQLAAVAASAPPRRPPEAEALAAAPAPAPAVVGGQVDELQLVYDLGCGVFPA